MPLYDLHCTQCEGIFEKLLPVTGLHAATTCPYCKQQTNATPALNAARVGLRITESWKPRTNAERLAGNGVAGQGTSTRKIRNSVLHNCKGHSCSICDLP
ncbi:MAG: zinc ribbon domain-containing protein [Herminiimonas sp.]|nr:zinc ribbon domain-containing protein [Herminiimonas sp.]